MSQTIQGVGRQKGNEVVAPTDFVEDDRFKSTGVDALNIHEDVSAASLKLFLYKASHPSCGFAAVADKDLHECSDHIGINPNVVRVQRPSWDA